ncbi:MAG: AAA family ATPase, partial [Sinobacteraceae bacterium]|nr:AAA family ATPase [Nevskiaceae bacterium]
MTSDSVPSDLNAMPQEPCDARNADSEADEAGLSDLDHALADWAFRHGADELVACGFAIANWAVTQGHTCLALNAIPRNLMRAQMQRALPAALAASLLAGGPGSRRPLIVEDGMLYLQRYHAYETQLAERLRQLLAAPPELVDVARLQRGHGLFDVETEAHDGTNWQAVAAFVALRHRFSVISGGPGTGKTYIIVRLLRVLIESALAGDRPPPRIALAAPTGKAAARMVDGMRGGLEAMAAEPTSSSLITQHIPTVAMTLHRLLGLTGSTTKPRYHADNPVPADVVIVDEASMVDLPLMAKLAAAVRADGRLILLGDRYQLASVESGSVLAGICSNAGVNSFTKEQQNAAGGLIEQAAEPNPDILGDHVVTLQTSRRFNADSNIGRLARAVNAGDAVTVHDLLSAGHADLIYRNGAGGAAIERLMDEQTEHYDSLRQATDPALAVAQLAKCCILTAVRNG